jgi:hypothetical protein
MIDRKLREWEALATAPERAPMRKQVGLPSPAGRLIQMEQELVRLRSALQEACAALRIYT